MKRISLVTLFLAFCATAAFADLVAPANTITYITSSITTSVVIESNGVAQLQLPASSSLGSTVANSGILSDASSGISYIRGAVSGTGAYVKDGSGTTILTGSNTYSGYTVVNSGILQTGTLNTLSQQSAVYIGASGTLDLNGYQQSVGSISGGGAILMGTAALPANSGLVNLDGSLSTGSNSVVGAGAVSGGVLTIGGTISVGTGYTTISSSGGLSLIAVGGTSGQTVAGTGTIVFNSETSGTNVIFSGSGTLNTGGSSLTSGSLVLSTNVNISVGTTLTGTLNLSALSSGTLTNMSGGTLLLNGTYSLSNGATVAWSGTGTDYLLTEISGTTVIGTTTLSGSSLTVSESSARMLRAALSPNLSGSDSVLVTGYDNLNTVYSGTISGNGQIVKTGTGTWNLTGINTSPGMTTVADGALLVNGTVSGDVFVWGGYLGGSGIIGGSVLNESVVSPGNSPGTLTIAGDYSQASTGSLLIQIASTSVYDRLVIGGKAYLDGSLVVQYLDGFTLSRGETFSFLSAAGGVSGSFSQVVFSSDYLLGLSVVVSGTTVSLDVVQGSFANDIPGLTPNEKAVATALDKVVNRSGVSRLIDKLDAMTLPAIQRALDKIAPTDLLPMFDASFVSADVQMDNIERRLEEIRAGWVGPSCAGLHLTNQPSAMGETLDPKGKTVYPSALSDRWGFFANGSGEFADTESTSAAHGTNLRTAGVSAGADYRLGDHAVVGAMAGYANTTGNGSTENAVQTDSGKLGVFGSVFGNGFFANAALGGGLESYDTKRDTVGGTTRGSTDGTEFDAAFGTGYTYRRNGLSLGPIASLRYDQVEFDSFTEHGSLAPLRYGDQSEDSLRSLLGIQIAYLIEAGNVGIRPQVRAQWKHEYLDGARSIGASFLPGGGFVVSGPETGRDSLLLDAGFGVQLSPRLSVGLFYTGDLGRENYGSQSVNSSVDFRF
ncbi:MAG: autotransporter domain-containing protein [Chthoniobacteraceae bacterium]